MLKTKVKKRVAMKASFYSINLLLFYQFTSMFFRNSLSLAMTVITLLTVFTRKHCFSKRT